MDFRKAMLQKIKSMFVNSDNPNPLDLTHRSISLTPPIRNYPSPFWFFHNNSKEKNLMKID